MSKAFNFKRFNQVLAFDWKRFIRNFGITLLVWMSMPVMFWVTSLVFTFEFPGELRIFVVFGLVAITVMSAPSRIYGKVNLPREGVGFAMLPATNLEKFFSMFLYCSLITPFVTFVGAIIVDSLMTLLPFGGFVDFIPFKDVLTSASFGDLVMAIVSLLAMVLAESSIFMFGNMLFKRRKGGKTFGWFLLIMFTFVLLFELTGSWQVFEYLFDHDSNIVNLIIFSAIFLVIACGFYFGTYRKIKTQKY